MDDNNDPPDPLVGLNLGGSGITNLSPTIGIFNNISTLILCNNYLIRLPPEIGKLTNLQKLDVSKNRLSELPREIGRLRNLTELDIHGNMITTLPPAMGRLFRLEKLRLEYNPLTSPPYDIITKDVRTIIYYLRDHLETRVPLPPRTWVSKPGVQLNHHTPDQVFKVMCYNVLAQAYATPAFYPHCPSWALDWSYRSNLILQEIVSVGADIVCLQEIQTEHFETLFVPELAKHGYTGIHRPKSRYNTMHDEDRRFVDGCCIFWKSSRFELNFEHLVDFVEQTMAREYLLADHNAWSRLISKDNIGLVAVLEFKPTNGKGGIHHNANFPSLHDVRGSPQRKSADFHSEQYNPGSKYILICNTHIHWNPEFNDVKLMQSQLLIEEVQKLLPRNMKIPIIFCGDFNSTPDSGVWEFLQNGYLPAHHPDFGKFQWGHHTTKDGKPGSGLRHHLNLHSAYTSVNGAEPEFTNASPLFRGCLSYIWFSQDTLKARCVLETPNKAILEEDVAMPNSRSPSDHVSLVGEFALDDGDASRKTSMPLHQQPHHPQQRLFARQK
eukprot:c9478_g1_i1.p1 GENE.c9478_g1_i1~~c9478_g1_i1.p1  ORF type:complete len:560 (+),score=114.06 c9478_g1_i1:23-1681(+)